MNQEFEKKLSPEQKHEELDDDADDHINDDTDTN